MQMKMTRAQTSMFAMCLATRAAWVTTEGSESDFTLSSWADRGWVRKVEAPGDRLSAYAITEVGRDLFEKVHGK